jgi:hypothetical protein
MFLLKLHSKHFETLQGYGVFQQSFTYKNRLVGGFGPGLLFAHSVLKF